MNTVAEAASGWSSERPRLGNRARLRDTAAPLAASLALLTAHFLFGAALPLATLSVATAITLSGLLALAIGGPRHATLSMALGAGAIWIFGVTGLAGRLDQAIAPLAALFAAGAMWTIGYVAARQRGALDTLWTWLIWTSLIYSVWFFFTYVSNQTASAVGDSDAGFVTAAAAPILFGLFALTGMARVLHVLKHMSAEGGGSGGQVVDRMVREGLGGILLAVFAMVCLLVSSSQGAVLLSTAVVLGYVWWDTRGVVEGQRAAVVRLLTLLAPLAALGLAAWGVALSFGALDTDAPGAAAAATASHIGRLTAYFDAFLKEPVFGHGLGSIQSVGDQAATLYNAEAMLAPGGSRNVFLHWLVEGGGVITAAVFLPVLAMHKRIAGAFKSRRIPRTFLRLAFAASALMLLHGASDSSLDLPAAVWFYALILGSACGVASLTRKKKTKMQPV